MANYIVRDDSNSGPETLREAWEDMSVDTIEFDDILTGAVVNLATSLPTLTRDLSVTGYDNTLQSKGDLATVTAGTLTLKDVAIDGDLRIQLDGALAGTFKNCGSITFDVSQDTQFGATMAGDGELSKKGTAPFG